MSEENLNQGAPIDEVKAYSEADVQRMIEEQTSGLKNKVDELLGEKKSASQKAKDAEERAQREAEERAKQQNDFKSLYESSEKTRLDYEQKYQELHNNILREKIESESMKIASDLADGNNAVLLSDFIKRRVTFSDDGVIVLDEKGQPTVSTVEDLKKDFQKSGLYDALLRQSKANGGGATGANRGGASIGGGDLSKMSKQEKLEYFRQKRES